MSLSPEAARQIVESGTAAPSGDNLQPWLLSWRGDMLQVRVDPARDVSIYNFKYRPSHIALGAMLENVIIAAREHGLHTRVTLSDGETSTLAADLTFNPDGERHDPLFPSISRRCTNRRMYERRPLVSEHARALREVVPESEATFQLIEDAGQLRSLAEAASLNDRLLFEIQPLHDGFFETLRWTDADAEATRDGLHIRTLELGPMAVMFKAMRSWRLVRATNLIGGSVLAPGHSFRTFLRSSAFGFLQMPDASLSAYVKGGRLLQRLWLTATSLGLNFQPMAGMLYLLTSLRAASAVPITAAQRAVLARAEQLFKQVLPLDSARAPIMLFRVGYGPLPSATSLRRKVDMTPAVR